MRLCRQNRDGFTILEMILVVILLGVLASIALPRMRSMIERSRTAEAYRAISALKPYVSDCIERAISAGNPPSATCSIDALTVDDPSDAVNSHFDYSVSPGQSSNSYIITATRNSYENFLDISGEIKYYGNGYYCGGTFYDFTTTAANEGADCGDIPLIR